MTPSAGYDTVLNALRSKIPELEAAALVSPEGIIISSLIPTNLNEEMMGTLSAAVLRLGSRIAQETEKSHSIEQLYVKGSKGYILISGVGNKAILVIMASHSAKLGIVFLEMKRAAEALLGLS